MKILRTYMLLLGALCGAAGLSAQILSTEKYKVPAKNGKHADYELAASYTQNLTMAGDKDLIKWECYIHMVGGKPYKRTTPWFVGTIDNKQGKTLTLDALGIGLQDRTHIILVRLVPSKSTSTATLELVRENGSDLSTPKNCVVVTGDDDQAPSKAFQFLKVEAAGGWNGFEQKRDNRYRLTTNDPALRLEVMFWDHPPGTTRAQTEDGGPPSIPPGNEN